MVLKKQKLSRPKASLLYKIIPFIGFYGSLAFMASGDMVIAAGENQTEGFISHLILSLFWVITIALIYDRGFQKVLSSKLGLGYFLALSFYIALGLIQGSQYIFLRADLGTFLWVVGGLALFRLMLRLPKPKVHLFVLLVIITSVIHYAQMIVLENPNLKLELFGRVIAEGNILLYYSSLALMPTAICFGILGQQGILWIIALLIVTGFHVYDGIILSGTRSIALSLMTVLIFSSVGLSYRVSQGVLTTQKSKYSLLIKMAIILIVVSLGLTLLGVLFSDFTVIGARTAGGEADSSNLLRVLELVDALSKMSDIQLIIGGGLGYAFDSILAYRTAWLHIGVFTFILKGGIILFSLIVFFLYIRLPWLFLMAWLKPSSIDPKTRTALLVTLPGIFGWLIVLITMGGYTQYSFLGVGFGLGAFLYIRENGFGSLST